jgi:hypothetical protein
VIIPTGIRHNQKEFGARADATTSETTMSNPYLPAELLDHIVDHLHDTQDALRNCCLVSKSWIPRTRKRLFANIGFHTAKRLQSWKETFPDPSTSPAHYAETLSVSCRQVLTAADAEVGWIRGFFRVVHLDVNGVSASYPDPDGPIISLLPFHGLSPATRSLRIFFPALSPSHIFDLILSFPLLEDLVVIVHKTPADDDDGSKEDGMPIAARLSTTPMFTGSLELHLLGGMKPIARRLFSLPGGIHFRKFTLTLFCEEDLLMVKELVEECSHTLESLNVIWCLLSKTIQHQCLLDNSLLFLATPRSGSVDLSRTTRLKDVVFRWGALSAEWVITTLQTISPKHQDLRQITIEVPHHFTRLNVGAIGDTALGQWLDLDRLLVQFWESRSIRPRVVCSMGQNRSDCVGCLLPEITKRGLIDPIQR